MAATRYCGTRVTMAALLASTILTTSATAQESATAAAETADDGEIIVTAQKRSENLQKVPLSIQAFGTEKLDELQVQDFEDYARYLPSVSYQTGGPGFAKVYFRGVASGENANHSASLPSVGIYLDEQPITTITGALDMHVYDISRVEALAGPQGTLYGASSQAGTIRLITNKPETGETYGAIDAEVNSVAHGDFGYVMEGFTNIPVSDNAAIRLVGWYDKDGGYIDNIEGCRTYPTSGVRQCNSALAKEDFNEVETYGARASLKIDLDETWTILPQIMAQKQDADGSFQVESGLGRYQTEQYNPELSRDKWAQAALTIQGKIGTFDLTYAGAYLKRKVTGATDYSDYAYFYDALAGYGAYFTDNAGNPVNPNQYIQFDDRFTKQSHELRLSSGAESSVRFIGGLFYQRQTHNIEQNYIIDNIADAITVPGTASNIWLTKQFRVDRDYAAFGEVTVDLTEKLKATVGGRVFRYDNSLVGFFGFSDGYSSRTGIAGCRTPVGLVGPLSPAVVDGSPCTNVDKVTKKTDVTYKANLTYEMTADALVYATYSRGFRPGGINRRGTLPPYAADFIDNYEIGWKTSFADRMVRWNGAIYQLDWTDIQLSFLGANGLTEIRNAGNARIRGVETDLSIRPAEGVTLSAGAAYNDAQITRPFCRIANASFDCALPGPAGEANALLAPDGTRLPVTARLKGNLLGRFEFGLGSMNAHVQAGVIYEGRRTTDLRLAERGIIGDLDPYAGVDLSFGVAAEAWTAELFVTNLFDERGQIDRNVQCVETVCGDPGGVTASGGKFYTQITQPRLIGLKLGRKF